MIFELKMGSDTLVGLVGQKGQLFWGAVSVAKLLRYKSPYYFSGRKSDTKVKDVGLDHLLERYSLQSLQLKVLTHTRLLGLLEKSSYEHVQLIHDHLNRGNFYVNVVMSSKGFLYPHAKLCPPTAPHARHFYVWIEEWKRSMLRTTTTAAASATTTTLTTSHPAITPAAATTEPVTIPTAAATTTKPVTMIPTAAPTTKPVTMIPTAAPTTKPVTMIPLIEKLPMTMIPPAVETKHVPTTTTTPDAAVTAILTTTTDADDEREEEDVKPPTAAATIDYSPHTLPYPPSPSSPTPPPPQLLPERGPNSIGKIRRGKVMYNEYGSPSWSFKPSPGRSSRAGTPSSISDYTPYSPSHPPYTPPPPTPPPPPPPPPQQPEPEPEVQQPEPVPEQDQPLDLSTHAVGGISLWFDSIPGTKIFMFQGNRSYTYYRQQD